MTRPRSLFGASPTAPDVVVSEELFRAIGEKVLGFATTEDTHVVVYGETSGAVRWARNAISEVSAVTDLFVRVTSTSRWRGGMASTNRFDDASLRATVAEAEALTAYMEPSDHDLPPLGPQAYVQPALWYDATSKFDAAARSDFVRTQVAAAAGEHLQSAGSLRVGACGVGAMNARGVRAYAACTTADYTVTARASDGSASGWAGVSAADWSRVDGSALTARAIGACKRSVNPIALEPGRYTVILAPQAVADLMDPAVQLMERMGGYGPYDTPDGGTKIGRQIFDRRLSIIQDPLDPDDPSLPFDMSDGAPVRRTLWVANGVLCELPYVREYAVKHHLNDGLPLTNTRTFRITGGNTSVDQMIATTNRGLLVTRFGGQRALGIVDGRTLVCTGATRDGVWLIERGTLTRPVKNFRFDESPLYVFNNVEQLGTPVRTYGAVVAPPIKVRDFNFVALSDSV